MVKLTLDGAEVGRFHFSLAEVGAQRISDLHVVRGGSIYLGLDLMPNSWGSGDLQMASFDQFGGTVSGRWLTSPPIARSTPRQILRYGSLCVGRTGKDADVVLAVNTWGPQVAILGTDDFEVHLNGRIPIHWARPKEHSERPGHWGPMNPVPRVTCGEDYAVVGYRRQFRALPGITEVLAAAMVVIDLQEGSITIFGGDEPPEPGSVLFMTPGAAIGDRFFFFTNSFFGHPVIREYRLVQTGDKQ